MNKKTFFVALIFLCAASAWLLWLLFLLDGSVFDVVIAVVFVAAGAGMVYNECHKKQRKHIDDVKKNKIS